MVCDFCSDENPVAMFTIQAGGTSTAIIGGMVPAVVQHVDDGQWAACAACRDDILRAHELSEKFLFNQATLNEVQEPMIDVAMRSRDNFKKRAPDMPDALIAISISDMHSIFWNRYDGSKPTEIERG